MPDLRRCVAEERPPYRRGGAPVGAYRHDGAGQERQGERDRRALCRNEGTARRVLSSRRRGLERGDPARRENTARARGHRRGSARAGALRVGADRFFFAAVAANYQGGIEMRFMIIVKATKDSEA